MTRAVALGVDALAINVVAALVGALVSVIASLVGGNGKLSQAEAVVGGVIWFLWSAVYFVSFWTLAGQTPGARLLGFRVLLADGGDVKPRHAVRRFVGLILSLIPLGAGFLPVLVDDRRRGLHDRIGCTVVRWNEAQAVEVMALEPGLELAPPSAPATEAEPPPFSRPA